MRALILPGDMKSLVEVRRSQDSYFKQTVAITIKTPMFTEHLIDDTNYTKTFSHINFTLKTITVCRYHCELLHMNGATD